MTAAHTKALEPCPFCGVSLAANDNPADLYVRRYGTHYEHPAGFCPMAGYEVTPATIAEWNTRAALREPVAEGDITQNEIDEATRFMLISREARNAIAISGGIDRAFHAILSSKEPDAIHADLVSLVHASVDMTLSTEAGYQRRPVAEVQAVVHDGIAIDYTAGPHRILSTAVDESDAHNIHQPSETK